MSTPCSIIVPNDKPDGKKYKWIYVHWDGTPDWTGVILHKYYNTEEKIKELISLGALSSLGPEIGTQIDMDDPFAYREVMNKQCIAYHRDRNDDLEINETNSLKDAAHFGYAYLWQNNKWNYCYGGKTSDLFKNKDFTEGLKKFDENLKRFDNFLKGN